MHESAVPKSVPLRRILIGVLASTRFDAIDYNGAHRHDQKPRSRRPSCQHVFSSAMQQAESEPRTCSPFAVLWLHRTTGRTQLAAASTNRHAGAPTAEMSCAASITSEADRRRSH